MVALSMRRWCNDMAIHKPSLSVAEAKRLANIRLAASGEHAPSDATLQSVAASVQSPASNDAAPTDQDIANPIDLSPTAPTPPSHAPTFHTKHQRPAKANGQVVNRAPSNDGAFERAGSVTQSETQVQPNWRRPPRRLASFQADKVQVFVSAPMPAQGTSPIFERLCQQYPPRKALQMILRRALHDYDLMLESGAFHKAPASYRLYEAAPTDCFVQTSRMMSTELLAIARNHFDPLGLESTRAFGRKLATTALASFFACEPKSHG